MIDPSKPTVLTMDLGSYCDNKLGDIAFSEICKRFNVVYVTDNKHKLDTKVYTKVGFDTPAYFTSDPDIKAADPTANLFLWAIRHPTQSFQARQFTVRMRSLLDATIKKYKPACIVIMYPAMLMTFLIDKEHNNLPMYVLYVAPAIANYTLPWVFNSRISTDLEAPLYSKSQSNRNSGLAMIRRYALSASFLSSEKDTLDRYLSLIHVCCWDPKSVPALTFMSGAKVVRSKALFPREVVSPPALPPVGTPVRDFVDEHPDGLIFLSFGSYGGAPTLRAPLKRLLELLKQYCENRNGSIGVMFHNGGAALRLSRVTSRHVKAYDGFIQYETIVPKCKLVIFTGSVCLQNICMYNGTPMMFFPLLTEQFYWARNYAHHTSVPFIDHRSWSIMKDSTAFFVILEKAMRRNPYLTAVRRSMRRYGPEGAPKDILSLVKSSFTYASAAAAGGGGASRKNNR